MDVYKNKAVFEGLRKLFSSTIAFSRILSCENPKIRMSFYHFLCFNDQKFTVVV